MEFCLSPRERVLQYPSLRAFSEVIQYMISKIAAIFGNQLTETVTPDADPESVLLGIRF